MFVRKMKSRRWELNTESLTCNGVPRSFDHLNVEPSGVCASDERSSDV